MNKQQWKTLIPLLNEMRANIDAIEEARSGIETIRDAEQQKLDNMPEGLRNSDKGEALDSIVTALSTIMDFDVASLTDAIDDVEGYQ
jgi:hypothetical protein